jgi:hypothetical protein
MSLLRSLRDLGDRMLYTSGSSGANQKLLIITSFNLHRPLLPGLLVKFIDQPFQFL